MKNPLSKESGPDPAAAAGMMLLDAEADCIICGCADLKACKTRCAWAFVDRERGIGICTNCIAPLNGGKVRLARNLAKRVIQEGIADKAHEDRLTTLFGSAMMLFKPKPARR